MRVVAILMVRNGVHYVDNCIKHLLSNGVEVAVIDHGSVDGTWEACEKYRSHGLCHLSGVEYKGVFSLREQLRLKQEVINDIDCDWVIHQDIDECLLGTSNFDGSFLDEIKHIDSMGYNVMNFNEFVFLPYDFDESNFILSPYYYFFEPSFPRLMRVWKKSYGLSGLRTGGHVLRGEVKRYPFNGILKHYIFTSQQNAYVKYMTRFFDANELNDGWHRNRVGFDESQFTFPDREQLEFLAGNDKKHFCVEHPWAKHYWDA